MFCISLWLQSYYIFARNERFAPIIFNLVPFRAYIIILVAWDSMGCVILVAWDSMGCVILVAWDNMDCLLV